MRILLVEDDELLAAGLLAALGRSHYRVEHVGDGGQALGALGVGDFDLLLLDLGLPGRDGIEVLKSVRGQGKDLPVLILSARDATRDRVLGLDAGADDYLTKPFELEELLARLRALERRRSGAAVNRLQRGRLCLDLGACAVTWDERPLTLNRLEFMLLRKLAEHPQQIYSRAQLEESLYGWGDGVESNTIEVFIYNLRKKLGHEAIRTVRGIGYRIGELD